MSDSFSERRDFAWLWKLLLGVYWVALMAGTHLPPSVIKPPPQLTDKLWHFGGYMILAFLLAAAWQAASGRLNGRHLRLLWIAIAVFAVVDEVTQAFVGREPSARDWLADVAGAAVGLMVFRAWQQWTR